VGSLLAALLALDEVARGVLGGVDLLPTDLGVRGELLLLRAARPAVRGGPLLRVALLELLSYCSLLSTSNLCPILRTYTGFDANPLTKSDRDCVEPLYSRTRDEYKEW
jgi:hypothetical protein